MLLEKSKIFIYIILSLLVFNFIIPICSLAVDEDSIYVWSNNSSFVSTSNAASKEIQGITQDNSRKLFRNHFRWCYINGPKDWNYFVRT